jgi:hypothetical protein
MKFSIRDRQIRMNSMAYFDVPLTCDNQDGPKTRQAFELAQELYGFKTVDELFDPSGITRIHLHWTASSWNITSDVTRHYNDVFGPDGLHFPGGAQPQDQAIYSVAKKIGVSHTLDANTGAIGLAVAGMADAVPNWSKGTVDAGTYPLNWVQIDAMLQKAMEYCYRYDIKVSPWTVLTHAEIQPTLLIPQNGKWDIRWLPHNPKTLLSARAAGDILRARLKDMFTK